MAVMQNGREQTFGGYTLQYLINELRDAIAINAPTEEQMHEIMNLGQRACKRFFEAEFKRMKNVEVASENHDL